MWELHFTFDNTAGCGNGTHEGSSAECAGLDISVAQGGEADPEDGDRIQIIVAPLAKKRGAEINFWNNLTLEKHPSINLGNLGLDCRYLMGGNTSYYCNLFRNNSADVYSARGYLLNNGSNFDDIFGRQNATPTFNTSSSQGLIDAIKNNTNQSNIDIWVTGDFINNKDASLKFNFVNGTGKFNSTFQLSRNLRWSGWNTTFFDMGWYDLVPGQPGLAGNNIYKCKALLACTVQFQGIGGAIYSFTVGPLVLNPVLANTGVNGDYILIADNWAPNVGSKHTTGNNTHTWFGGYFDNLILDGSNITSWKPVNMTTNVNNSRLGKIYQNDSTYFTSLFSFNFTLLNTSKANAFDDIYGYRFNATYIFTHTNITKFVLGANEWTNMSFEPDFDGEPDNDIKYGILHDRDSSTQNHSFQIQLGGIYDIEYDLDMIDTSGAPATTFDVAGRVIYDNGTELDGSIFETTLSRQDAEVEVSHTFLARLEALDVIVFQFIAEDAQVEISTHGTFGDQPESASVVIERIDILRN